MADTQSEIIATALETYDTKDIAAMYATEVLKRRRLEGELEQTHSRARTLITRVGQLKAEVKRLNDEKAIVGIQYVDPDGDRWTTVGLRADGEIMLNLGLPQQGKPERTFSEVVAEFGPLTSASPSAVPGSTGGA